jgi:hypothetical protein
VKNTIPTIRLTSHTRAAILCAFIGGIAVIGSTGSSAEPPPVDEDGTIHVPAFVLPESAFLSEETRAALKQARRIEKESAASFKVCLPKKGANPADRSAFRKCEAEVFYKTSIYEDLRARYAVTLTAQQMGGSTPKCSLRWRVLHGRTQSGC